MKIPQSTDYPRDFKDFCFIQRTLDRLLKNPSAFFIIQNDYSRLSRLNYLKDRINILGNIETFLWFKNYNDFNFQTFSYTCVWSTTVCDDSCNLHFLGSLHLCTWFSSLSLVYISFESNCTNEMKGMTSIFLLNKERPWFTLIKRNKTQSHDTIRYTQYRSTVILI